MKRKLLFIVIGLMLILNGIANQTNAQPVVAGAKPGIFGDSILCPNATGVLYTQKIYDSYQWYKRDFFGSTKTPVKGATTYQLTVDNNDILEYFSVEVTLKSIKKSSDEKLIDGYVFNPPSVLSGGDFKNGPGFFALKQGDTGLFTLLLPYDTNITWYKGGSPVAGATKSKLYVTEAGSYTVSGAPHVCPNYIQNLGLNLIVKVKKINTTPVITGDSLLCPNSTGTLRTQSTFTKYQWYKRFFGTNKSVAVKNATTDTLSVSAFNDAPAYFSVKVINSNGDTLTSAEKLVDSYAFLPLSVISDGDFINGPGFFVLKQGDTGRFTITQPYSTNITWYRNNTVLSNEHSVTLDVTKGGSYFVTAAPAVCPDYIQNPGLTLPVRLVNAKQSIVSAQSADASLTQSKEITLYPNPAKNYVMVDVASFVGKDIEIRLSGSDGKTVFSKQFSKVAASVKLDLYKVQPGNYYVTVKSNSVQHTLKLIVAE